VRTFLALILAAAAFAQPRPENHRAPYLSLREARTVATRYARALPAAQPRATTRADFDEDGMPDLAAGLATSNGAGAIAIHRGNVHALWPYGPYRGTDQPAFLPDARVFSLPEPPDFLAAGDFDADGHYDIVAAQAGGAALYFLKGDGHGGFADPQYIPLPGAVTAMTAGEFNRPDGLADLMVAVTTPSGPQALVFESPAGAIRATPETFDLPAAAASMVVMPLDGGVANGLAIAAGRELLLIHGRDRKLTLSRSERDSVPPAEVTRQAFPFTLRALAVGRFTSAAQDLAALGDDGRVHILERSDAGEAVSIHSRLEDARPTGPLPRTTGLKLRTSISLPLSAARAAGKLVTARVAATGRDSLIVLDPDARKLHIVSHPDHRDTATMALTASMDAHGAPVALEAMRINKDALHDLVVLTDTHIEPVVYTTAADFVFTVTDTTDASNNSLRTAIQAASMTVSAHFTAEIDFNIPLTDPDRDPTTGVFTIQPVYQSDLEALPPTWGTTIDGYTQPGSSPNTLTAGDNAHPLIEINGSMAGEGPSGLELGGGNNLVRGLVITNFEGKPSTTDPRYVDGGIGIDIESGDNIIEGNFLGIDAGGAFAKANEVGIEHPVSDYTDDGSTIGGTTPQARNIISGNVFTGVTAGGPFYANTFFIQGNYIGMDRTGTNLVSNRYAGINLISYNVLVGGTAAGAGNLLSGNAQFNIVATVAATGPHNNLIQGNTIGPDITGTVPAPFGLDSAGVGLAGAQGDLVGGTTPAARNVISGNNDDGIMMVASNYQDLIQGNYIGLDPSGTSAVPNKVAGVSLGTDYYDIFHTFQTGTPVYATTIGGETPGAANVISGNTGPGVSITSHSGLVNIYTGEALNNVISGNLIGVDAGGVNALGNQGDGISITTYAAANTVGGTDPAAANVIAYNTGNGVTIDPGATAGATNNAIVGNAIYSNGGTGVRIPTGTGNRVSANSVYSNGALGIDIDAAGVLVNSTCQANTNGANLLQNAPVLTAGTGNTFVTATATDHLGNTSEFSNCVPATLNGNLLDVAGMLDGASNGTYTIEYFSNTSCDPSGNGQGRNFLGSTSVTTANCDGSLNHTLDLTSADLAVTNVPLVSAFYAYTPGPPTTSVVTNAGPKNAAAVIWTDVLPANVSYLSATTTQGNCAFASQTITCNLGDLRVGGTITIAPNLQFKALGSYTNTVSVASSTSDANPANNSASANFTIAYAPALDHLTPPSVNVGSPDLTLTVVGQGFMPTSVVSYNGAAYPTTFNPNWPPNDCANTIWGQASCTALTITVPASLLTTVATVPVTVNGASGSLTFNVIVPPVVPGPVTHFVLSGIAGQIAAGSMQLLFITAKDAAELTVSAYRGTVDLTSTDTAPGVFTNGGNSNTVTFTAADGGMAATVVNLQTTGVQSITAADSSNATIEGTLSTNVANGPAGNLSLTGTPQATPVGQPFSQPLQVTVTDVYGNPVPNQKVTFTAPTSGAGATLSSTTAYTNSQGVAYITATANGTAGAYQVGATYGAGIAGGGPNADVFLLTNGTGLATLTATAGTPQYTFAGQLFPTKLQAQLKDGLGNPISGATVWFNTVSVGGYNGYTPVAIAKSAVTDSSGAISVTANAASNGLAGLYPTTASIGGLTATFDLTIKTPQPIVLSTYAGTPQNTAVGYTFSVPLSVLVTDGWGNPRSGVVVTFIPPASGATAVLPSGTASTNGSGIATITATANNVAGTYTVSAGVGGVTASFTLTNSPIATGPPATIGALAGTPQTQSINVAFATPFQVVVKNAAGDPLPGVGVTFAAPSGGASGTFSGSPTVLTNGIGVATAPTFTANSKAGTYTVTATAGTVSTTFSLTNTGGAPAALNMYGGNNQTATLNSAFGTPLAVQLVDGYGNPCGSGYGIYFFPTAGTSGASGAFGGSSFVTVNTANNGVATAGVLTANGTPGTFTVTAMYTLYVNGAFQFLTQTFNLNATAATPAHLIAVSGTPQSVAAGNAFPAPLVAKVTDSANNPLAGFTVTFTAPASGAGAVLSSNSSISDANGLAAVNATANASAGSFGVTAAIGSLNASFALTNVAWNRCDINQDKVVDVVDAQLITGQALGASLVLNDLTGDGIVNVVDVQIVIGAAMGGACAAY